jgi:hypothetical protein
MDSGCIFIAYGVILMHLEVDKITWGVIFLKRGANSLFGVKEGRGAPFLTGVENTAARVFHLCITGIKRLLLVW